MSNNQSSSAAYDSASARANIITPLQPVDLKELFAYKVLEKVGFGPKTDFIINNNLPSGLYISTEEIIGFTKLSDIIYERHPIEKRIMYNFKQLSSTIMKDDFIPTGNCNEAIIKELTKFDILVRSLLLGDLNDGNIGFIIEGSVPNISLKIIDFARPIGSKVSEINSNFVRFTEEKNKSIFINILRSNEYIYFDIIESFLNANDFTKYPDILKGFFVPALNLTDEGYDTYKQKFRKQKKLLAS